ncbi:MAG: hypothetical protein IPH58_06280 [Sphingobacteriales bacterium]|nr:hypothetical protein [Sphingobacteriales bacterium]
MACGRSFVGGLRIKSEDVLIEYLSGKQTYDQLAEKYNCSNKTIQRKIDQSSAQQNRAFPSRVNVLMDSTYFGKSFGVMVFKDSITGVILLKKYVKQETNLLYLEGMQEIAKRGIKVQSIICDGRRGLFSLFTNVPMQYCEFHQVKTIRTYLTKKPEMQASKELWELALLLRKADKESFVGSLDEWHPKWEWFLSERKIDEAGKKRYVHKKLRSAYRSLKTNLPWLFTWYDNLELNIPNTTNAIDGHFSDLKNKLSNHNGLSIDRKKKLIDEFFKA